MIGDPAKDLNPAQVFGALLSYPGSSGEVRDYRSLIDKLHGAGAPLGITQKDIPGAFCPFMKCVQYEDGRYEIEEPDSRAGDYLDLRADMDLFVAISNCPQERNPCNGFNPTPLKAIVYQP